jgi:G:T-mismatch repair DNA endonuclease (very short patch repair protein)
VSFDFLINDNFLIEVNGDYWHANPKLFKESDTFFFRDGVTANEIWLKDHNKLKMAKKEGFKILTLWESDINKASDDEIKKEILEFK